MKIVFFVKFVIFFQKARILVNYGVFLSGFFSYFTSNIAVYGLNLRYTYRMKNTLAIFTALLIYLSLASCSSSAPPLTQSKLLFKSGFEEGVTLGKPYHDGGGTWLQDILGSDHPDFSWPIRLWDTNGTFQVLVDSSLDSTAYITNTIVTTPGHDGQPTRAMRSTIHKAAEEWTQDPYILMDAKEQGDLYVRYWLKMPGDLRSVLGDGTHDDGWCTFFEWKSSGDYRIAAYIYIDPEHAKPYWYVHGDNVANSDDAPPYHEYWVEENDTHPVPEDRWFMVEFFWHRSTGKDGRFWWAVDGQVIADHHGANKIADPIDRIMLFTTYAERYPLTQLVDDIEIWDGFPCGEGKSCYQK